MRAAAPSRGARAAAPAASAEARGRPLAIVHTENSCGWGGQEIRTLTEARGFQDRGHRVTLVAPDEAPIAAAGERLGLPVVRLDIRAKRPRNFFALRRFLASERARIDVVNTHSSTDSWLAALACATLRDAPPIVRTRHVSTTVRNRPTTRWLYTRATAHVVTTGEALKRQLARDNGVPLAHMTSIPTGIDLARFVPGDAAAARARLGVPPRPTLGIVATLRDWKGHDMLFEALARDRAAWDGWNVVVVGNGPYRDRLDAQLARLGLAERIRFAGQQDDVVPWLQALDLFTLPSWGEEGVPQAIVQAMACGLPVVSTTVGAITEAVVDGVTGLVVPPRDVPALGAALARLRDDAPLRARLGAAGGERARAEFGIERMLDRMEAVFRAVTGKR
ncbi:MAG TPA: glycosyltransferase family 4 protein [Casimicrobiaceae bacterium]|nr:glycosyltransferase family 4 protein [Casimicrobiaceae bacterium]